MKRIVLLFLLVIVLVPAPASAFDTVKRHDVWSMVRGGALSVLDPVRQRWIVLGGTSPRDGGRIRILDLEGAPVWQGAVTQGGEPSIYGDGCLVYDSTRERILYFKPEDPKVYSLSLAPPMTWSSFTPVGGGAAEWGMVGAYDARRDRVVLFGGYLYNPYQPAILETHGGTRILDLSITPTWISPGMLGTPPTRRACGAAVWDPAGDRMIVHGGFFQDLFSPTQLYDTYTFSYLTGIPIWTKLTTTGPSAVREPAVFDTLYRRMILPTRGILELADSAQWASRSSTASVEAGLFYNHGAVAIYDAARQRLLWGGGIAKNVHGSQFPIGGFYQSALGAAIGPASTLALAGDPGFPVSFGGYDRVQHRFVGLVGTSPLTLSVDDTTWTPAGETGVGFSGRLHPFYDDRTNTLYAVSPNDLYVIQPGSGATWTHLALAPPVPAVFDDLETAFLDAARQRVLVIGARQNSPSVLSTEFWQLTLGPVPAWTKLADSTPLGARVMAASIDVRRDRALFFGGSDVWALDLATLAFSQPAAAGAPPSGRPEVAAVYDSTRDRLIVTGDSLAGTFNLQFGAADPNGTWLRNDPAGPAYPMPLAGMGAYDPGRDRLYVADATRVFDQTLGPYTRALSVATPSPQEWTPASVLGVYFAVTHGVAGTHTYAWSLRSDRAWPFLPLSGQVTFTQPGPNYVGVPSIAVPDSAASGSNTLHFEIHDVTDATIADSVTVALVSALPTWTLANAIPTFRYVALTWRLSTAWSGNARLERRPQGGTWNFLADAPVGADSSVSYLDETITQGQIYGYRTTLTGTITSRTSAELVVAVPVRWSGGTATAEGDSVRLTWHLAATGETTARIQRRLGQDAWTTVGDVAVASDGTVTYRDAAGLPPGRYGYRAGIPADGEWSEEVLVDVARAPVLWTGGTATAVGDTVLLAWHLSAKYATTARIERRRDIGAWARLTDVHIRSDGIVTYAELPGLPDGRYVYRAGILDVAGDVWSSEVVVDVGQVPPSGAYVLAFAQGGAMIVSGIPEFAFTLPVAGSARLELFDLKGRRVAQRSLEAGQPGQYVIRLDDGTSFRPGVYFLRLTQGAESVRTRALVLGGNP